MTELSIEEKANRYDEIQRWWWADRRAQGGFITKIHWKCFIKGIKEHLEPYKEERQ